MRYMSCFVEQFVHKFDKFEVWSNTEEEDVRKKMDYMLYRLTVTESVQLQLKNESDGQNAEVNIVQ